MARTVGLASDTASPTSGSSRVLERAADLRENSLRSKSISAVGSCFDRRLIAKPNNTAGAPECDDHRKREPIPAQLDELLADDASQRENENQRLARLPSG